MGSYLDIKLLRPRSQVTFWQKEKFEKKDWESKSIYELKLYKLFENFKTHLFKALDNNNDRINLHLTML